jgi:adenosylcobyric acid synthase
MKGRGLLVAGTSSDAGKSIITAGICRWLHRQGVRVAPFKAQNMSNNSVVVLDAPQGGSGLRSGEIGRAQAMQAAACGLEPSVRFNPILLKPGEDYTSQVVALGRPVGEVDAAGFRAMQKRLRHIATDTLEQLRTEFDVVVCEGAGSPAEINLRRGDFVNMGLARGMHWPVIVVGDIDRGGVLASLYGTIALLSRADQKLVAGMVINKFRGDLGLLRPGIARLETLTGRPVYGVVPWQLELWLDSEDSLGYGKVHGHTAPPVGAEWLRVAVVRLPHISNATDVDALATEPGVQVRFTIDPGELAAADLIILPGSKSTVADLHWLRQQGLGEVIEAHVMAGRPLLGVCGGFQMLARQIHDDIESSAGTVPGLGLLPIEIHFGRHKIVARTKGFAFEGIPVQGYEIHHGYVSGPSSSLGTFITGTSGTQEGVRSGVIFGTHWHGIFENDTFRRAFLAETAHLAGRQGFVPATDISYAAVRERMLDTLGDLVEQHLDTDNLWNLIEHGPRADVSYRRPHLSLRGYG